MRNVLRFILVNASIPVWNIEQVKKCMLGKGVIFANSWLRAAQNTSELLSSGGLVPIVSCDTAYSNTLGKLEEFVGFQEIKEYIKTKNPVTVVIIANQTFFKEFIVFIEKVHSEKSPIPDWKPNYESTTRRIIKTGETLYLEVRENEITTRLL